MYQQESERAIFTHFQGFLGSRDVYFSGGHEICTDCDSAILEKRSSTKAKENSKMKKVQAGITNDYSKHVAQFRYDQNLDYNLNSFQWPPSDAINQNKQNNTSEAVTLYPAAIRELPQFDQEEMLSWYQTVPLRHDPQDFDGNGTIQELQLNRKERLLTERQKRFRTSFTTCQLGRLEEEFQNDKYAVGMKRMRLARELGLTEKQIKVWYQNRRMKYKRVCQRIHNKRMAAVNTYW